MNSSPVVVSRHAAYRAIYAQGQDGVYTPNTMTANGMPGRTWGVR